MENTAIIVGVLAIGLILAMLNRLGRVWKLPVGVAVLIGCVVLTTLNDIRTGWIDGGLTSALALFLYAPMALVAMGACSILLAILFPRTD